jgi:alkylation response protein AidB-like acyl-CoA dehydrogenase
MPGKPTVRCLPDQTVERLLFLAVNFDWPEDLRTFRDEVRQFVAEHRSPEIAAEIEQLESSTVRGPRIQAVVDELDRRGWLRLSWPPELGGQGKSIWYQFILTMELRYGGLPYTRDNTASMVGPAIHRFGTEKQKQELLPKIWSGEITCALGYSEPDAGTDLASLKLRAVRDGDEYVINGQKIWTSSAHRATHVWLAARTDPEAPKHRGISVFLFPLSTPGITIRPIYVLSGARTNEVFYEDVRVPADTLIGEENRGWYIMTSALDHERVTVGVNTYTDLVLVFEGLVNHLKEHQPQKLQDPLVRTRLAELKVDLHVLRSLLLSCTAKVEAGEPPTKEASMVKVWGTELRSRLSGLGMDLIGRAGGLGGADAPAAGAIEQSYKFGPISRFTAGANEVQRNIIAQRGLGLPR